jgi:heme/copper-type cytochrome/quinol oxidase subunit 2
MSRVTVRASILTLIVLIVLVVLFFLLRPSPQETSSTSESTSAGSQQKTLDLAITNGTTMTPSQITVNEGDHVTFNITSDEPLEFHLHGYDLEKEVEANEPAQLSFDATDTGRFEIEAHLNGSEQQIGEVQVQPR